MGKFPFPRIHGPDHDLCIRSINKTLTAFKPRFRIFGHLIRLCLLDYYFYLLLDIFKFDPDYLANEEKYNQIKKGYFIRDNDIFCICPSSTSLCFSNF